MRPEEYERWYATPRGRWISDCEVALLIDALRPQPGESLLDVGCGTGHFTREVGRRIGGFVAGIDLDVAQVSSARRHDPGGSIFAVANACSLPFPDASFDLVIAVTSLGFVADEPRAVREIVRVARRGFALGLLHRHSLLWLQKSRGGGRGGYRSARWHTMREAKDLLAGLPVHSLRSGTAVHLPGAGPIARAAETIWPRWLPTGAFLVVSGRVSR